jgi:hypothetical protein
MIPKGLRSEKKGQTALSPPFSLFINAELYDPYHGFSAISFAPFTPPEIPEGDSRYVMTKLPVPLMLWEHALPPHVQIDKFVDVISEISKLIELQVVTIHGLDGKLERGELWAGDDPERNWVALVSENEVTLVVSQSILQATFDKIQRILTDKRSEMEVGFVEARAFGLGVVRPKGPIKDVDASTSSWTFHPPQSSIGIGDETVLQFQLEKYDMAPAKAKTSYVYQQAYAAALRDLVIAFHATGAAAIDNAKMQDMYMAWAAWDLGAYGGFSNKDPPTGFIASAQDIQASVEPFIVSGFASTYRSIHFYSGIKRDEIEKNLHIVHRRILSWVIARILQGFGTFRVGGQVGEAAIVNPEFTHQSIKEAIPYRMKPDYELSGVKYPFLLPAENEQTDVGILVPMAVREGIMEWAWKEAPRKGNFRQVSVLNGKSPLEATTEGQSDYLLSVVREGLVSVATAKLRQYKVFQWPEIKTFGVDSDLRDPFTILMLMGCDGVHIPNKALVVTSNWMNYYNERVGGMDPNWFGGTGKIVAGHLEVREGKTIKIMKDGVEREYSLKEIEHMITESEVTVVTPSPGSPNPKVAVGDLIQKGKDAEGLRVVDPQRSGRRRGGKGASTAPKPAPSDE